MSDIIFADTRYQRITQVIQILHIMLKSDRYYRLVDIIVHPYFLHHVTPGKILGSPSTTSTANEYTNLSLP